MRTVSRPQPAQEAIHDQPPTATPLRSTPRCPEISQGAPSEPLMGNVPASPAHARIYEEHQASANPSSASERKTNFRKNQTTPASKPQGPPRSAADSLSPKVEKPIPEKTQAKPTIHRMKTTIVDSFLENEMREIVGWYTAAAAATGAVPVPASSAVIVVESAAMITHLSALSGQPVSLQTVIQSMGLLSALNLFGKAFFIEGAKLLGWGTGSFWALAGLCGFGAATAGVQTYIIGMLSLAIIKNGGRAIPEKEADQVIEFARRTYNDFVAQFKDRKSKPLVA
jgi:hypothetical protein